MATRTRAPKTRATDQTLNIALIAARAADSKKAAGLRILDLREISSFTDLFLVCSGANQRQIQAIADEVETRIKKESGRLPLGIEGYDKAEWVLLDFGDVIVHVFSPAARSFYDLERLWRTAKEVKFADSLKV